ncbi:MAG: NACHT domain-containing protein [Komarekiella atlantica HA4396-MV6]|jgi:WD40 repeat protein/DNA-binding CsgD family transcriptional regulator|nr:NACHT domain-containing protein [Komarekiella atlantica HA4396-MV6]
MSEIPEDFILALAQERCLSSSELEVLLYAVQDKSPNAIAIELGISAEAVRKRLSEVYKKFQVSGGGPGKLTKLQQVIKHAYQASSQTIKPIATKRQDWGEAPSIRGIFYGREAELSKLKQWIVKDNCRLVALLGMGGIGKTTLSVKLADEVQENFEYFIWRTLRNAPPIQEMLANLIRFLSDERETNLPETVNGRVTLLIKYLREHRCLLLLDNAETILQASLPEGRVGYYKEGYEGYGQLLRRVGEEPHQSCLVITSREKPNEFAPLEGEASPVRTMSVAGVGETEGQEILKDKSLFGSQQNWAKLIENYSGNPLALKLVSETIRELFGGDIAAFLDEGEIIFGDTRNLLDQQFERASEFEKEIIYWLAIKRDPVSLEELLNDIVRPLSKRELLEALKSLRRRSLIEKSAALFTLQPVVMEYITESIIEQVCQEITTGKIALFMSHGLMGATVKDYVRDIQIRLILKPILERLLSLFLSKTNIEDKLTQILEPLQDKFLIKPGYAGSNVLHLLYQLQTDLTGYDFSHLTVRQAYLQNVNLHQVSFAYSDLTRSVFAKNFATVLSVTFSRNGQLLATGDANGEIRLWQVINGQQLLLYQGHTNKVWSIAFNASDTTLVSASEDQTLKIWDVQSGECLKTLLGHTDRIWSVAFSPQGHTIASASEDQTVKIWDVQSGECLKTLSGHINGVRSVDYSPDGKTLVSGSKDQTVKIWDVQSGECLKTLLGHTDRIWSVAFSPQGHTIASASDDQTVKLWDVDTGECLKTLSGHTNWVWSVDYSPQGNIIVSGSDDQTVRLWDVNTGKCLKTLPGHTDRIWSVAFSPQGRTIASTSDDQTVKLWDADTGRCLKTLKGYTNWVWCVAFSPNAQILASANDDYTVRLWDINTDKCLKTLQGHTNGVRSVAFSPDGQILASASDDQTIKLWNAKTGICLHTLKGHTNWVWSIGFSPNGQILASASDDQTVKLWDVNTGKCFKTLSEDINRIWFIAFSPKGDILAGASEDHTVKLWNVSTGESLKPLQGHTNWVRSVAFSPRGDILASASEDHTVRLWKANNDQRLEPLQPPLKAHTDKVRAIAFSPRSYAISNESEQSSYILASAGDDNTVKIWDVTTGQCLQSLQGHTKRIWSVVFSPDGQFLASGGEDETVRIWNADTGECLKIFSNPKPYKDMDITGSIGLTAAQKVTLKALGAVEDT